MQQLLRVLFFVGLVRPLLSLLIGVNVFGRKNLPKTHPFIIVANHNSHLDALALMALFPLSQLHRVHPVAASDYFLSNPVLAWFSSTCLNILPIPRKNFTKRQNPKTLMGEQLDRSHSLIIFPEGSRGEPEQPITFKSGIAHIIQRFPDVPVVPVCMRGMGRSLPRGELFIVPFFCDVFIGEPRTFQGDRQALLTELEEAVWRLPGEYGL